jgi:hypothetical protein
MEDHLKNKDRLEQEWVALCAYEAEPCATTVAQKVSWCFLNMYYCESDEHCVQLQKFDYNAWDLKCKSQKFSRNATALLRSVPFYCDGIDMWLLIAHCCGLL